MAQQLADDEGTTPLVVRESAIAGLGLFATGPGKPAALEYMAAAGRSGLGTADDEAWQREELEIWTEQREGWEYLMSVHVIDDAGFRDEDGKLRHKMDAESYVGRCAGRGLTWNEEREQWDIRPQLNYAGMLDELANPAAFCNDRAYGCCATQAVDEYTRRDAALNGLVMVPGLRRVNSAAAAAETAEGASPTTTGGSDEVEFTGMWLYPRRGWIWPTSAEGGAQAETQHEVTVGYWWPNPAVQPDSYARICTVS